MADKPHIAAKFWPVLQRARAYMNSSQLFGRGGPYGFTGGDNLADQKHSKLWSDFGYPTTVEFYMHWNMWRRNGLARRGAKLPVDKCWLTNPVIKQCGDHIEQTAFERAIHQLNERLRFNHNMYAADLCQRIGRYGALLITVADSQTRDKPLGREISY